MGGQDRKRRSKLAAQLRQRDAGFFGDLGKADLFDRLLGQQGQDGGDDPIAVAAGGGRRRGAPCGGGSGRFASRSAGHDRTPELSVHANTSAQRPSSM